MNQSEFETLCRAASEKLGIEDKTALGLGEPVEIDEVIFETTFVDGDDAFLVLADLGEVAQEDRVSVHETLLAMQLEAWNEPRVRFGFHPVHDAAMLCGGVDLNDEIDGAWLA